MICYGPLLKSSNRCMVESDMLEVARHLMLVLMVMIDGGDGDRGDDDDDERRGCDGERG